MQISIGPSASCYATAALNRVSEILWETECPSTLEHFTEPSKFITYYRQFIIAQFRDTQVFHCVKVYLSFAL